MKKNRRQKAEGRKQKADKKSSLFSLPTAFCLFIPPPSALRSCMSFEKIKRHEHASLFGALFGSSPAVVRCLRLAYNEGNHSITGDGELRRALCAHSRSWNRRGASASHDKRPQKRCRTGRIRTQHA